MKSITLTGGLIAHVDDEDYEKLIQYNWIPAKRKRKIYAFASLKMGYRSGPAIYMHQLIMNPPNGFEVDHRDGNGLNNQKANLRLCSHQQNCQNAKKREAPSTSKYKGVLKSRSCRFKPWRAYIKKDNRQYSLRHHETEEAAARAYDAKAKELFGEFACLNFPEAR